jgi:hypothetical protein
MNIFEMLDRESRQRGLPFLIIGGHAINAYGYSRFTKDLDILVNQEQREAWEVALQQNGLALFHDGGSFLRFTAPSGSKWPLDLMLVNSPTFAKLRADAREHAIGPQAFRIPSLDGLIALKFHVLKQEIPERGYKDLLDVLELARCNGIDLHSERVKNLCDQFGSAKIYERLIAFNT